MYAHEFLVHCPLLYVGLSSHTKGIRSGSKAPSPADQLKGPYHSQAQFKWKTLSKHPRRQKLRFPQTVETNNYKQSLLYLKQEKEEMGERRGEEENKTSD